MSAKTPRPFVLKPCSFSWPRRAHRHPLRAPVPLFGAPVPYAKSPVFRRNRKVDFSPL